MLCAVVADTRAHAKQGAAAVQISYEDLPEPVFTTEVCGVQRIEHRTQFFYTTLLCIVLCTEVQEFSAPVWIYPLNTLLLYTTHFLQVKGAFVVSLCDRKQLRSRLSLRGD